MITQITSVKLFRSFQHQPFALLWGGQTLSRVGDYLFEVALAWWVLQKTGSAAAMASVFIFALAPTILFSLLGGVAVDRYPRLPLMIGSDLIRGLAALVVAGLTVAGELQLWHVYGLTLIFGLVDALFQPAFVATVPALVPEEDLGSANSLTSLGAQAGRIVGPPLGAALIALGGVETAFAINGLTFFASALFLMPLSGLGLTPFTPKKEKGSSVAADFKEGLQTVRRTSWLWLTIGLFALVNVTLAGPYMVAMPFLVKDHLGADVATLGLLYAMFATGYVLGGIWLGQREQIKQRGRLIYLGVAVAGLSLALFGLPVGIGWLIVAALLNGAALEMGGLAWTTALQELVPRNKLGRVVSVDLVGSLALVPAGMGLAGWLTELWGAQWVFILGGGLTMIAALLAYRHPAVRALD